MAVGNLGAVTVVVANPTDESVETTLVLRVEGATVTGRTVTVPAGGQAETTFTHRFDTPGEFEVSVGDVPVGVVTATGSEVTTASTPSTTDPLETATGASGPGFGVGTVAVSLLLTVALLARRRVR